MKRLSVLLSLVLGLSAVFQLSSQELQVYYFPRPPLYIKAADGTPGGFITEIARLVLNSANVSYKFVEFPSSRVEPSLKNRDFAVGLGWFKNPTREEWANFSDPIYQDLPSVAIVNNSKLAVTGQETTLTKLLTLNLTMGTIDGFSHGSFADSLITQLNPKTEKLIGEQANLVAMVARGRADFMLLGLEEAGYLLETSPDLARSLSIVKLTDWPAGNFRYFMFSKAVPQATLTRINQAITQVKAGAEYKKITDFSKYLK
jgi:polar amino acid transport system substrate-binding protein